MIVGITGTRNGMNELQRQEVRQVLHDLAYAASEDGIVPHFHHGDCVGVDVEAAAIAEELGYVVIGHPPNKDDLRGFYKSHIIKPSKGYFERNRDIVDSVEVMLVVPKENEHQSKGGTWYTCDYATKRGVLTSIFYPGE